MEESKKLDLRKSRKVNMDNRLIIARYSRELSLLGQKLIRIAIASIDSVEDRDFILFETTTKDLRRFLGIPMDNIYRDIKNAAPRILETKIAIQEIGTKEGDYEYWNLFSKFIYKDGHITIKFSPDVKNLLLQLKSQFTSIKLENLLFLNHKYSIRVYELVCLKLHGSKVYADKHKEIEISVAELRRVTGTEDTYRQINHLLKRVIEPAVEDIETYAALHLDIQTGKRYGREIISYRIDVWSVIGWRNRNTEQLPGQMSVEDIGNPVYVTD